MRRLLVLGIVASACGGKSTPVTPVPDAGVQCLEATPCTLAPGTASEGDIATVGQQDFYQLTTTSPRTIAEMSLIMSAPATPVRLVLQLESSDGTQVIATRGPIAGAGPQSIAGNILIVTPGTYRIVVRDALNTHADPHNTYTLGATLITDPDANEVDDTPAQAVAMALDGGVASGYVAFDGDRDLRVFDVASTSLWQWSASVPAGAKSPLQLHAQLLKLNPQALNDLNSAIGISDAQEATAGAGLTSQLVRSLDQGRYLISFTDKSGLASDPLRQWQTSMLPVSQPDGNEPNDTSATATTLGPNSSLQGAIASQGDVDWYAIPLTSQSKPYLLQIELDPQTSTQDIQLYWAVGTALTAASGACDLTCGPADFCASGGGCNYDLHALHTYSVGDSLPEIVRIRQAANTSQTVRILVRDFGDKQWSPKPYKITTSYAADPDANELNDTLATATPTSFTSDSDAGLHFHNGGTISSWDNIDGVTQDTNPKLSTDVDWYQLPLPPRAVAPACPEQTDGAVIEPGPDGGLCNPLPDGGVAYMPRPDYGISVRWKDPADGDYGMRFIAKIPTKPDGGGSACVFAFDEYQVGGSNLTADSDGGVTFAGTATSCFCLPASHGNTLDQVWVRAEPTWPQASPPRDAGYSDNPYQVDVAFNPGVLQPFCDGGCAAITQPSSCPGE